MKKETIQRILKAADTLVLSRTKYLFYRVWKNESTSLKIELAGDGSLSKW